MQPRQIYASSLTRRERRWTRRRARGALSFAVLSAATVIAALSVLAIVVPGIA